MKSRLLAIACLAVLCITLSLGLWPFHAPRNNVAWIPNRNGLRFGRFATAFSAGPLAASPPQRPSCCSLEIWVQAERIKDLSTILAFYPPQKLSPFSLRQAGTSLVLEFLQGGGSSPETKSLYVSQVFRRGRSAFITVSSGADGTAIYIDGMLAKRAAGVRFPAEALAARMVLGDGVGQGNNWSGQVFGLAIYNSALTPQQALQHYHAWKSAGGPRWPDDALVAAYRFNEHTGRVIHGICAPEMNLHIPQSYTVLGKLFLENPWREFNRADDYWGSILKNVVGFVPLGFCFYSLLSLFWPGRRAAVVTVILGLAVSSTIEVLQVFLPTRASGVTDLFTNTIGTWIGVQCYGPLNRMLDEWLPFYSNRAR